MKTLRASIFDPDFEPSTWNLVDWKRDEKGTGVFGDPDGVNPIFQRLLDPIISRPKEIDADTGKQALHDGKPVLVVSEYVYNDAVYTYLHNIEHGKFATYTFHQVRDIKRDNVKNSYVIKIVLRSPNLPLHDFIHRTFTKTHYYLISKRDAKTIKDFYDNLQANVK